MATRAKKPAKNHASTELLKKLKFVAQIQKKDGDYSAHCVIRNKMICASDGVFSIGTQIDEDIEACPHSHSFIAALSKCGEHVSIAVDKKGLSVMSGKLSVKVATMPHEAMPPIEPDLQVALLNNDLKKAFEVVGVLAKEGELRLPLATLLLEPYIVTATNGYAAMQYRHGIDLPPDLVIPKKFCDMVVKNPANLTAFGWSPKKSVTFWFDDGSFIKTQLQRGQWPNVNSLLDGQSNALPLPDGFMESVNAVTSFSPSNLIEFGNGVITSDTDGKTIASYEVEGLPDGKIFNGATLSAMLPNIQSADFRTWDTRMMFFGCNGDMRGALSVVRKG